MPAARKKVIRPPQKLGFISYAHDDYAEHSELKKHLASVERALNVSFWSDVRISAGNYWSSEIRNRIDASEVFLLFLTPAFIASSYIYDEEIPAIKKRLRKSGCLVVPVVLRRCYWEHMVDSLQAVPTQAKRLKPIESWRPTSHGYDAARREIGQGISEHFGLTPSRVRW